MTTTNVLHQDLLLAKELLYDPCGLELTQLQPNAVGKKYGACSYQLNGALVQQRIANITSTKTGQFVSIWKRNGEGISEPYSISDDLDFIIITVRSGDQLGQFVFPKQVLADHAIVSSQGKMGKRGIRVYPPWDITSNKQAIKTQEWQLRYFCFIQEHQPKDLKLIQELFGISPA